MYQEFFNLKQEPFSIAPDPRFLYMSNQHKEALAHLIYGIQSSGAFVVLSGEIGSGKTTVCRCFLEQIPDTVDTAFILNPKLDAQELLASICDEFGVSYSDDSIKSLVDSINRFLLENHAKSRSTVLIIEEAQNLSEDVLEQLRLLTNLETNEKKLLQIVLLAQPEFLDTLEQASMKQLAQRVTARFHLKALNKQETRQYILHRLNIAGAKFDPFPRGIKDAIHRQSSGVPRLINLIADRSLLGAYANGQPQVSSKVFRQALKEINPNSAQGYSRKSKGLFLKLGLLGLSICMLVVATTVFLSNGRESISSANHQAQSSLGQFILQQEIEEFSFDELILEPHLSSLSGQSLLSFSEASIRLTMLWGVLPEQPWVVKGPNGLCIQAAKMNLECFKGKGNIGLLMKLGRPAILKLYDEDSKAVYGVFLGLKEGELLFQFGERHRSLNFMELEKAWLGEYFMYAKTPEAWKEDVLTLGDKNQMAAWINQALVQISRTRGDSLDLEDSQVYGLEQVQLLKDIQKNAGIQADGKVGMNTVIYFNTLLDPMVPRLQGIELLQESSSPDKVK